MIDVAASMLRAAAKNFAHVAAVSSESQYDAVLAALREHGEVPLRHEARSGPRCLRRHRRPTSRPIRDMVRRRPRASPDQLTLTFRRQWISRTARTRTRPPLLPRSRHAPSPASHVDQLGAKELSYNNLVESRAGRRLLREFVLPAVVNRQARESLRGRLRGHHRGGPGGASAHRRSGVGVGCVALLNRPVFAELGRAHRRALRRGSDGSRLRRRSDGRTPRGNRRCDSSGATTAAARRAGRRRLQTRSGRLLVQDRDIETEERSR